MNKKEMNAISILTVSIAFMELTGIPSVIFINIKIVDIEPMYFNLMIIFLIIGIVAYFVLKYLCPNWELGLKKEGLANGLKKYGTVGVAVAVISFFAFYIGLMPFDLKPSLFKVLIEGVIYHIGVACIEELYIRGMLLNLIEKFCYKSKNKTLIAILFSSVIFGVGHIFGVLNQSAFVILSKVVQTVGMGIFFGTVYKKTKNLWLPIIFHFLINVSALPYCFSDLQGYANLTLYIVVPTYFILGIGSLMIINKD